MSFPAAAPNNFCEGERLFPIAVEWYQQMIGTILEMTLTLNLVLSIKGQFGKKNPRPNRPALLGLANLWSRNPQIIRSYFYS
jgi:hypothetical protein